MATIVLNSSVLTPRGFRPRPTGPREGVMVTPRLLWGADDIEALREAPLVTIATEPADQQPAGDRVLRQTVLSLTLAGVPVSTQGLPEAVREHLDPGLWQLLEGITPETMADPARRELASLALRRSTWQLAGYRPPVAEEPVVLALLPEAEVPETLAADLAAQQTPGLRLVVRHLAHDDDPEAVVAQERAVYLTRPQPGLRYGPHHIADLVHALAHSGARVALSPRRFLPWQGAWLEDGSGAVESPAEAGLPGGSLWYAVDGTTEPVAGSHGYAVHGTGAVPTGGPQAEDAGLVPLRLHTGIPPVLDWLAADQGDATEAGGAGTTSLAPTGPSYFAASSGRP